MKACGFIFARGGSKGLPGKNIRPFHGKPLIAWSIEQALSVDRIERVIVSTDSEEIAMIARRYGAEVPFMRPCELASNEASEWLAWRHALNYVLESTGILPEVMVSVPATAPLRIPIDIENCLSKYFEDDADVVVTMTDSHRSPYFNMVKVNEEGEVVLVIPPQSSIVRRQDVPVVYDMATVCYVANSNFVLSHNSIFEGRVKGVHVPIERSIDIDTLRDFKIAEYFFSMNEEESGE